MHSLQQALGGQSGTASVVAPLVPIATGRLGPSGDGPWRSTSIGRPLKSRPSRHISALQTIKRADCADLIKDGQFMQFSTPLDPPESLPSVFVSQLIESAKPNHLPCAVRDVRLIHRCLRKKGALQFFDANGLGL